jgi:hypothetical protein
MWNNLQRDFLEVLAEEVAGDIDFIQSEASVGASDVSADESL